MTPLRQRMIQYMQLRGFSARTQECYVAAVRQLAEHYHTSPNQLTEEDLRQYFLYLANEKKVARATATIALCGIKFFYEQTLQRQWPTLLLIRPPREKKLPVVLSREEVRCALGAVRIPVYRACLTTLYACGLRLLEGSHLQIPDIDSDRMLLHIHRKGKKDRYVPLPDPTLQMLRAFWRTHRSPCGCSPRLPVRSRAQPRPPRRPGHPHQSPERLPSFPQRSRCCKWRTSHASTAPCIAPRWPGDVPLSRPPHATVALRAASDSLASPAEPAVSVPTPARCPHCRRGQLIVIQVLRAEKKLPP
jgi:integrase